MQDLHKQGVEVIGDIELFARAVGVPVVAITGFYGDRDHLDWRSFQNRRL
ncbi:hypothetical protein THIOSC15_3420003 [uncultured Thiomicrorhabdus sp.]